MLLVPNDYRDFFVTINYFRVMKGGDVKVKLADHTVKTIAVTTGAWVNLPVRRIYATGTTAEGFRTELFQPVVSDSDETEVPYSPDTSEVPVVPPPPSGYDGNPTNVETNANGTRIIFTFDGEVAVSDTITVRVDGGPPVVWNNADTFGTTIEYVIPDYTTPITEGQAVTYTAGGGIWTPNPPVGDANDPVTDGTVTNTSTTTPESLIPVLLNVQVEADGDTFTFTWDRPVEIQNLSEFITQITVVVNGHESEPSPLTLVSGDGTEVLTCSYGGPILATDTVTFSAPAENWWSSDYHVYTLDYGNVAVTNLSEQT